MNLLSFYFCIILVLISFSAPSNVVVSVAGVPNKIGRTSSEPGASTYTTLKNDNRVDPSSDCGQFGSRSECAKIPNCRWCKSDALDDMCFPKYEAWRLPSQVFSLDNTTQKMVSSFYLWQKQIFHCGQ
ncbi:unnamed protein product [Fraxinus pennsylvanica]|uniref:Uncharacterized protein n=1 Tax=Fraxinus pennsylvanica TaxID=56036 RepID=A0AAD2AGH7_9LAMI|nr:unnamed protein product [Fraxinus pennsylvanica]